jgi:hypothetical protein
MTTRQQPVPQSLPVANYSSAIATAVKWLGDRYLLARPINVAASREMPALPRTTVQSQR